MDESQPISPRARLQQLLAIPDRQRTDAEWDELNELEIMLAAGNRPGAPEQNARWNRPAPGNQGKPAGGQHDRRPGKRFHPRPQKRHTP
ncbi:MAG: hypothetical protein HY322_16100 [Betaproteobacteria bacterium]|nr:hypothetical protein [Betaproteobacteria bacterium]